MKKRNQKNISLKDLLLEWAKSEKHLHGVSLCDTDDFLLQTILQKRSPLIASLMMANIKSIKLSFITIEDIEDERILALNQKRRGWIGRALKNEPDAQSDLVWENDDLSKRMLKNKWNFIAVKRPGSKSLTVIDGLHRLSELYCENDVYDDVKIKGYIVETEFPMKVFEDDI